MAFSRFIIAAIFALFVWMGQVRKLNQKGAFKPKSEILKEEAIAAGRVTVGRLVKQKRLWNMTSGRDRTHRGVHQEPQHIRNLEWRVTYEYEIDGRTYRQTADTSTSHPPKEVEFYYEEGKPKKAFPNGTLFLGAKATALHFVPFIIAAITYWVLGWIFPGWVE